VLGKTTFSAKKESRNFILDLHDGDLFGNFTRTSGIDFELMAQMSRLGDNNVTIFEYTILYSGYFFFNKRFIVQKNDFNELHL